MPGVGTPRTTKVFCVGSGRTGTTSLASFFDTLGYRVGAQHKGEALLRRWAEGDYAPIVTLAESRGFLPRPALQLPATFQAMDTAFPGSKFILTWRQPDEWYRSLTTFHTALVGKGHLPTAEELNEFSYIHTGWILEALRLVYGISQDDPYNRDRPIRSYEQHGENVKSLFCGSSAVAAYGHSGCPLRGSEDRGVHRQTFQRTTVAAFEPDRRNPRRLNRLVRRSHSAKDSLELRGVRKAGGNQLFRRFVDVGMRKATLDEGLFAQVVVAEVARPADRARHVGPGLVDEKRREYERVALHDFDRHERRRIDRCRDVAVAVLHVRREEAARMASRKDFQRAERSIDGDERHPDDD